MSLLKEGIRLEMYMPKAKKKYKRQKPMSLRHFRVEAVLKSETFIFVLISVKEDNDDN